jgi:hypothetical protein
MACLFILVLLWVDESWISGRAERLRESTAHFFVLMRADEVRILARNSKLEDVGNLPASFQILYLSCLPYFITLCLRQLIFAALALAS